MLNGIIGSWLGAQAKTGQSSGMSISQSLRAGVVVGVACVIALAGRAAPRAEADAREFPNPVLRGYHADPTICRVGDDYYLATSSSEYFPGLPIYHSRDLVNWRLIGHALHRPEQIDLAGVENSKGVFAPTLRHHAGFFYLVTTLVGAPARSGNFMMTATNPAGPWSDPVWLDDAPGIDPSLFFDDDGRVYYCGNRRPEKMLDGSHRVVWVQEIDVRAGRLVGPRAEFDPAPLYATQAIGPVGWLEAPHLYQRGGWYYLLVSHGGTWLDHAVSFWRSRRPLGPWEMNPANPVLTHRGQRPAGITSTGHADLVQTPGGEWWAVLLAIRGETGKSVMGRETFLCPVDWSGEWPVFNAARRPGRVELSLPAPTLGMRQLEAAEAHRPSEVAGAGTDGWVTVRAPRSDWIKVEPETGRMRITASPDALTAPVGHPSARLRRVTEERFGISGMVEFAPTREGARAGLTMLRARDAVWLLAVEQVGGERVARVYRGETRVAQMPVTPVGPVELRVELRARRLEFLVREPGATWRSVASEDAEALATSQAGRFTGTMAGVFAQASEPVEAVFDRVVWQSGEDR
jgi:xylan 1,4-beta-xylosidase